MLGGESDIAVVGCYSSGEEALAGYKDVFPDLMIVDLKLPGMSGVEFIKIAKAEIPMLNIMVHTGFHDTEQLFLAIKAGTTGYILKGCRPAELVEAVYDLHNGGAPMTPSIARIVITALQNGEIKPFSTITKREQDILKEINAGKNYKEIAGKLHLSHHTVRTHIKNIYEKLHVRNKQQALIKAHKADII